MKFLKNIIKRLQTGVVRITLLICFVSLVFIVAGFAGGDFELLDTRKNWFAQIARRCKSL